MTRKKLVVLVIGGILGFSCLLLVAPCYVPTSLVDAVRFEYATPAARS